MSVVYFDETPIAIEEGKSVLDTLLDNQVSVDHGCKSGICQSCLLQAKNSEAIPSDAQKGLSPKQINLGCFLACQCHPKSDIYVDSQPASAAFSQANVLEKSFLSRQVIRLKLRTDIEFKAGQFVNLKHPNGIIRSYSIANQPNQGFIELHIKHYENGAFSHWAATQLKVGDKIEIQGPFGQFYYQGSTTEKPLLCAAINTGLAPIMGILKDALLQASRRPITLFIGAKEDDGHYFVDELEQLTQQNDNIVVKRLCLSKLGSDSRIVEGDIYQSIKEQIPSTKGFDVYLCGSESFVKKLKKQCFLAGANMGDIHSDAFIAAQ